MDLNRVWSMSDLISAGLAYTVMGVLIVFAVLVIIMLVIKAMALFSNEKKKEVSKSEMYILSAPAISAEMDESELVAVITAAISAAMGKSASGFVIRSYKLVDGGSWNKAGRREVLENRF